MKTELKPVIELTDLEAEKELTELTGGCWHEYYPVNDKGLFIVGRWVCCKCGVDNWDNKPYATSFDAIIPEIQEMGTGGFEIMQEWTSHFWRGTSRELTNAVIEILRSK